MKKVFLIFLLIPIIFVTGCDKTKDPEIVSIEIENEFYQESIYVGDIVDLSDYDITITYDSGLTQSLKIKDVVVSGFSTSIVGQHEFKIKYNGFTEIISYTVLDITVVDCIYKGEPITIYKEKEVDLSGYQFTVLYSNGTESNMVMSNAEIEEIDLSLSLVNKIMKLSYCGQLFNVEYNVTYKPIIDGVEYRVDPCCSFFDNGSTMVINNNHAVIYNYSGDDRIVIKEFTATEGEFNTYTTLMVSGGKIVNVKIYLADDIIHFDIQE